MQKNLNHEKHQQNINSYVNSIAVVIVIVVKSRIPGHNVLHFIYKIYIKSTHLNYENDDDDDHPLKYYYHACINTFSFRPTYPTHLYYYLVSTSNVLHLGKSRIWEKWEKYKSRLDSCNNIQQLVSKYTNLLPTAMRSE